MAFDAGNGVHIPLIGYGTYGLPKDVLKRAIVEGGYRHIDTASYYDNEEVIGEILREVFAETSIKREDMFIVTKVWNHEKEDIAGALKASLARLGLAYVDLYLIHWPVQISGFKENCKPIRLPLHKQWPQMEEMVRQKLTRSIGVSNFNFQLLNDLLTYAEIRPVANQIELSPYLTQTNLVEWMKKERILPIAYCPLGGRSAKKEENFLNDKTILEIAERHKVTPAQAVLAWGLARGHASLPKSSDPTRMKQNIDVFSIKLSQEEVDAISKLDKNHRTVPAVRIPDWGYAPVFE